MSISLIAAALAFQAAAATSYAEEKGKGNEKTIQDNETDRVIVTMEKGQDSESLEAASIERLEVEGTKEIVSVAVPEGQSINEFVEELGEAPGVEDVEPDYLLKTTYRPNDPLYSIQYHHDMINSEKAWNKTKGSVDIRVAVLDDGFDLDHPDLRNQISEAYSTAGYMSEDNHGTHVAGVIGASMNNYRDGAGVAPNTSIVPIDVFEGELAYTSDVIEGVYGAANLGVDIINMSLGGYNYSSAFNNAVQYAYQNDVIIVAAAGNDDSYQTHYPSAYENVVSVGATNRYDEITGFSNYGFDQDIVAPGAEIWSTLRYGGYGALSGTSMASPVIAGVAALVKSNEPHLSNDEVVNRLFETAVDLGSPGKDIFYGHGRVDAAAALKIVDINAPEVSSVYDYSTEITGILNQAIENGTIAVQNGEEEIARLENYSGNTEFTLEIPQQPADSVLTLTVTDRYGNVSVPVEIWVLDGTAPEAPTVNPVTDKQTSINGTGEAFGTLYARSNSQQLGSVTIDEAGNFNLPIAKQKAGTKLQIHVMDTAGNESPLVEVVVQDVTAPAPPTVERVTGETTKISGTAEAGSNIVVKAGTITLVQGKADSSGKFSLTIEPQTVGTELTITAIDAAGNKSADKKITVVKAAPEPTNRIAGTDRYTTAIAISKAGWSSADTIVLATASDFPDALAGGPLAYQENAPILLTRTNSLTLETKQEIERLGATNVLILGSNGAVSQEVETELKRMGLATERLGGKTRFETAALIAGKLDSDQAVVANGLNFPDVLSVSSYAAKNGVPILLTRTDRLPDETAAVLKDVSKTYVIGSTGVVSKAVHDELPGPTRFGGKDRYETGYEVATKLPLGNDKAFIATGSNFPDALAGSVLAAKDNAPILLVRPDQIPEMTNKQLVNYDGFSIFGGTGAVSDSVKSSLDTVLQNK